MSAILLLDGVTVMIIISYRSPTITISLSLSIWSQFAMQASFEPLTATIGPTGRPQARRIKPKKREK